MSEPSRPPIMQHNPGFLAPHELIASFLARKAELESLLDTLRHNDTRSNQHVLILGRRGMGKTMLVRRLVLAIERDAELSRRWYPIVFGEEAYNVATAGELWLEALHQLAEQTGDARWRRAHVELRREREDRRLHDLALARLLDFADERGVRLVLAVENLQDLLGEQMSDDEGWVLRHTLLNEPRIMLLGSATSRFDDIDQPKKAFYELFATLELRPLERDEIRELWAHLCGERLEGLTVRPLEIFTGGSPRLISLLARFAQGHTLHDFMANLLRLIDANTDYFKSNIEALSLDERRVFMALCELWEPSPTRDVAEVARFDVNKTSMLLGRLVSRGAAEIAQARGRVQYYQCAERLYNLYHRLRSRSDGDGRAQGIVDFMLQYYSLEDVGSLVKRGAKEMLTYPETREDVLPVLGELMGRLDNQSSLRLPDGFWQLPELQSANPGWRERVEREALMGPVLELEPTRGDVREALQVFFPLFRDILSGRMPLNEALAWGRKDPLLSFTVLCMVAAAYPDFMETLARDLGANLPLEVILLSGVPFLSLLLPQPSLNDAIARFVDMIEHRESDPEIRRALASVLATHGHIDSALTVLRLNATHEMTAADERMMGDILRQHDLEGAEDSYRRALKNDPNDSKAVVGILEIMIEQGRDAEAIRLAEAWQEEHGPSRRVSLAALRFNGLAASTQRMFLECAFGQPSLIDASIATTMEWGKGLALATRMFDPERVVEIARVMLHQDLPGRHRREWFLVIGEILAASKHSDIMRVVEEVDACAPERVFPRHVTRALAGGEVERAFSFLGQLLGIDDLARTWIFLGHRPTLLRLALIDPERLHALLAPHPLFEPFTFALAQELGHDVLAPHEVMEIAKDIRAELHAMRGSSPYVVEPTPFAHAADQAPPKRKPSKRPSKKRATKKRAR